MAAPLRVFLSSDGVRTLLGQLTFQQIVVGRESPDGFTIHSPAVSREHGIFLSIDQHWFFKDLGSTNGTWINSKKIPPGSLTHLKVGDILQLGDSILELLSAEVGETPLEKTSVIVFLRDNYVGEFFLQDSGPVLVVGGPKSNLKKDVEKLELPGLVVERRGTDLTALTLDPKARVLLNGEPLRFATNLNDRDILSIESYSVHVSLAQDLLAYSQTTVSIDNDSATLSSAGITLKEWEDDLPRKAPEKTNFGKVTAEEEKGARLGATRIISALTLTREGLLESEEKLESMELSIVFILGGILIVLLLGLLIYWFLI